MDSGAFVIDPNGFFTRSFTEQAAIDWVQLRVQEEMADTLRRDR